MKTIFKTLTVILFATIFLALPIKVSAAFNPYEQTCSESNASDSSVCKDSQGSDVNPISGKDGIINRAANIIAIIAGIIAIVIIMISGLKLITSAGDSQKLTESRNAIIYASAGLVVIALARLIVSFIMGFL